MTWLLFAVLLAAVATTGCGEDDPTGPQDDPTGAYPVATTEDQLVDTLVRAVEERQVGEYDRLIHPEFAFFFAPEDILAIGQGSSLDRDQELLSAMALFGGRTGTRPDHSPQPAVESLDLHLIEDEPGSPWTDLVPSDFAGTTMKRYKVDMLVTYTDGSRDEVVGLQELYATKVEVDADAGDGTLVFAYQLKYWRDLGRSVTPARAGPMRSEELPSWGMLKSMYRFETEATHTRDGVVAALAAAYASRDATALAALLHDELMFIPAPPPRGDLMLDPLWYRSEEIALTENMFGGKVGTLADGTAQPPVASFDPRLLPAAEPWTRDVPYEEFEGTTWRRFAALLDVSFEDGTQAQISGWQELYLESVGSVMVDGISFPDYRIRYWRDLGGDAGLPAAPALDWSELKRRFLQVYTGPPPPPPYLPPLSQDQLVLNLVRTYNERNYEKYDEMLADGFVFYFAPDEVDELGQGISYDRAQDTRSTFNMFNGRPGQTPDGRPVAPVQKIQLYLAPDDGSDWTDQVAEQFTGTTMKRHKVDMLVTYTDGSRDQVTGLQEFYAAEVEVDAGDGTLVTEYRLKYWRDLGKAVTKVGVGTGTVSWGSLKALFGAGAPGHDRLELGT